VSRQHAVVAYPGGGSSNPSSEIPTSLTAGVLRLVDAATGKQLYLGKMHARHVFRQNSPTIWASAQLRPASMSRRHKIRRTIKGVEYAILAAVPRARFGSSHRT
jgi:hypothetical protein